MDESTKVERKTNKYGKTKPARYKKTKKVNKEYVEEVLIPKYAAKPY